MKYMKQKHAGGCGVATLAMATGISYDKALQIISPRRIPGSKYPGTTLEMALKALTKMKLKYRIIFDRINLERLENTAYISITAKCGCRHAVAWDPVTKEVFDPGYKPHHTGRKTFIDQKYIKKHMNFIVEIIPS